MCDHDTREDTNWQRLTTLSRFPSFIDAISEPVHRWYKYPAGFSPKAVEAALTIYGVKEPEIVLDPFAGTGTTQIVCKLNGVLSLGLEAHPLTYEIACTKLEWNYTPAELQSIDDLVQSLQSIGRAHGDIVKELPKLLTDCYLHDDLVELLSLRDYISSCGYSDRVKKLVKLALLSILRKVAIAETGWSYVLPKRHKKRSGKSATQLLTAQLESMKRDLLFVQNAHKRGDAKLFCADSRLDLMSILKDYRNHVDLTFTSPPYLNNYDYADRARLEMYFLEMASCWSDVTTCARKPLVVSCTTQVSRTERQIIDILGSEIMRPLPASFEIAAICARLTRARRRPNGKLGKSYDVVVARYFEDMARVFKGLRALHKKNSKMIMILGDSAPYGVYIDTPTILGRIAVEMGFPRFNTVTLRTRGNKWTSNGRRHLVPLCEKLLIIDG